MTASAAPMDRAAAAGLLGVAPDAQPSDVQRAFLRAARHTHPDTLPDADDATRAAAALRFDALTRARATLLEPAPRSGATPTSPPAPGGGGWAPRPGDPDGPLYRPVQSRGLGGSLVVLALLAFLLVALVTFSDGFRGEAFDPPSGSPGVTGAP